MGGRWGRAHAPRRLLPTCRLLIYQLISGDWVHMLPRRRRRRRRAPQHLPPEARRGSTGSRRGGRAEAEAEAGHKHVVRWDDTGKVCACVIRIRVAR